MRYPGKKHPTPDQFHSERPIMTAIISASRRRSKSVRDTAMRGISCGNFWEISKTQKATFCCAAAASQSRRKEEDAGEGGQKRTWTSDGIRSNLRAFLGVYEQEWDEYIGKLEPVDGIRGRVESTIFLHIFWRGATNIMTGGGRECRTKALRGDDNPNENLILESLMCLREEVREIEIAESCETMTWQLGRGQSQYKHIHTCSERGTSAKKWLGEELNRINKSGMRVEKRRRSSRRVLRNSYTRGQIRRVTYLNNW